MNQPYDFLVIGGGSAGYAAARTAHELGLRTAVVDGADELGGLCILQGCMPSKTLIESANRYRSMRRAAEFGLRSGETEVFPSEIRDRKRSLIGEFASYRAGQLEDDRFELYRGTGVFGGTNEVVVTLRETGEQIHLVFHTALIATGSVVSRIPVPGLEETGYWISDDVLEADHRPESIIVLGGGAIAVEMACYYEGLGSEVIQIQRSDHLLSDQDADLGEALAAAMNQRDNLTVHTGTKILEVSEDDTTGKKRIRFQKGAEEITVEADQILQALGRSPNTKGLNAEAAGVELERGRVVCDEEQRSSTGHIFAAGDVCGPYEVVHTAIEQGEAAAHNAAIRLGKNPQPPRRMDYRLKLFGVFSDPEVATVGLTEKEARERDREIAVATYPFDDHGKSMVMGETEGFVKMIGDKVTGEILGASVVGPHAVDLIHEVVVAMHFHATAADFIKIPHYHPTLSEIWTYPAEELLFFE